MADIQAGLGALGGAVSDLFAGFGASSAAAGSKLTAQSLLLAGQSYARAQRSYLSAEAIAKHDAQITNQITGIQEMQTGRQIYASESATGAAVGGAGFAAGGSGGDILRSSAQQGALAEHLIQLQGTETANAYVEQAKAYAGQAANEGLAEAQVKVEAANEMTVASAQKNAASGDFFGAVLKGISAITAFA